MKLRIPMHLIDVASIAAGGSTVSFTVSPDDLESMAVTVRVTYGAGSTAGITVNIYSSPDGANWDTDPFATFSPSFAVGATRQLTELVNAFVKHLRVEVRNNDGAVATKDVDVWLTLGG